MLSESLANLGSLKSQLSCGDQDQSLGLGAFRVDSLKGGDDEGSSLASTILGSGKDVSAGEGNGYRFFLNGGGLLESGLENAHHQLALNVEVLELEALGGSNVL
jgi:hypothetical protein